MQTLLPELTSESYKPTIEYLQDICKILGKIQQAYLPKSPHDYQYGLEITMRGIATQSFKLNNLDQRILIDLVRHKLRANDTNWNLREFPPAKIYEELLNWLKNVDSNIKIDTPDFNSGLVEYDIDQADIFAKVLWWMEHEFMSIKNNIKNGETSPILFYPHHFDLSLVWYPQDNDSQIAIGFSLGDEIICDPYIYFSAYPDSDSIKHRYINPQLSWHKNGFVGYILLYNDLIKQSEPSLVLHDAAKSIFK